MYKLRKDPYFPNLRHLELRDLDNIEFIFKLKAPVLTKVVLSLSIPTWDILRTLVMENMRALELKDGIAKHDRTDKRVPLNLKFLEELTLRNFYFKDFTEFLGWDTSELKLLRVLNTYKDMNLNSFKGFSFLAPQIRQLILKRIIIKSFNGLIGFLLQNPEVLELKCKLSRNALEELKKVDLTQLKIARFFSA
ncbi:hypothetical protein [Holospora curviuscula]|uniref:hypothetical protein n=1 Tax=Holospora curviuscula TaxID=1082868 RepID=UPI00101AE9C1|nr:hypothetical protein [Holospora curviuscula]